MTPRTLNLKVRGALSCLVLAGSILLEPSYGPAVTLPYYDGFNYAEGTLNNVGAPNWTAGSTGIEISVTNTAALVAPEGFPAATGRGVRRAPSGTARRSVLTFDQIPAVDGNEVYASFLIKVESAPSSEQVVAYLTETSSSQSSPQAGVFITPGPKLGVGKRTSTPGFVMATNLGPGVHLVVLRYVFQPGNDRADLWVDPPPSTYGAATAPPPLGSATGSSDPTFIGYFQIYAPPTTGGVLYFDELRIGTNWAAVVPSGGPPIGAKLVFVSHPTWVAPGSILDPVIVQIASVGGTPVQSNGVPVTLSLASGTGSLSGTLTRYTDADGRAVFDDLTIEGTGTFRLRASASGIGQGLADAISGEIQVSTVMPPQVLTITNCRFVPDGLVLAGVKGRSNGLYNVVASPDPTLPLTNWMSAKYGFFDAAGNFAITNPTSIAIPKMFYAILGVTSNTKLVPPSITREPANTTVTPGSRAVLDVEATGPFLHYLWLSNGVPLWDATGPELVFDPVSSSQAAQYSVIVANAAGAVTSSVVQLRVGYFAPEILAHPQNQTVVQGSTAMFNVLADGTQPLFYQWHFNGSPLLGATNPTLAIANAQPTHAGQYWVSVSNALGTAVSTPALLSVTETPTAAPPTNMVGFAALAGVTGGAGGEVVVATNYYWLSNYVRRAEPLVIQVKGRIESTEDYCYVYGSNKTIVGIGTNAEFVGDLRIHASNIIVANITFRSSNDGITIDTGSRGTGKYIWVDHCTFIDCADGSLDITKGADYVTVSWCKFMYPTLRTHAYVNLLGSSDDEPESIGKLHVTFCYNWYGTNCMERMPSVRYGRVHVFNNYYDCQGNNYCVRTRLYAQVLVENNYFLNVQNPWERLITVGEPGLLRASGNITNNCIWNPNWYPGVQLIPGTDYLSEFDPVPYPYTLLPAEWVPYYVTQYAGAGKPPYVSEE